MQKTRALVAWLSGVAMAMLGACASVGPIDDGSSLSYGLHNRGHLYNAVRLPDAGDGYEIPATWRARGLSWGTDEIVSVIVRAARRVDRELPGSTLFIGDLSPRRGGPSQWHHSHQTGRDADLIFFALDDAGRPAPPPETMFEYGDDGVTKPRDHQGHPQPRRVFDTARNWALARALVEDPDVDVQYLFVYEPLRRLMLDYAAAHGESPEVIERVAGVMHQPGDSLPHDDHMHLRIYCPRDDRALGCAERGPFRWLKKGYKYLALTRVAFAHLPDPLARPFCAILSEPLLALL